MKISIKTSFPFSISWGQNFCGMCRISNGFKIPFFQMENILITIYWQILKIWGKVWNVLPDLYKFVILFPNVKLKLGHNFLKLIYRLKIGAFECWSWAVLAVLIPIHNKIWNWDFWMLLQLDFSHFPNSLKRLTIGILNISLGCTSKFFPIP